MKKILLIVSIYFLTTFNAFAEFSFTFEWGNIKKCTTGNPNIVKSGGEMLCWFRNPY